MTVVGRVEELWRYPVKSMRGERLEQTQLSEKGVPGDRGWAIRDETAGEIQGGKKHPLLMQCEARYVAEPTGETIPAVDITLPDGTATGSASAAINDELSAALGKPVTLWPLQPATDLEHYRRRVPLSEPELRAVLGQQPEEATADLSWIPDSLMSEIGEFTSPRGTYFDAFPIHLLTTSWLAVLAAANPDSRFEPARYRPNLVIQSDQQGLPERDWCGRRLHIGDAVLACEIPTLRCIMTSHQTGNLPKDIGVVRAAAQMTERTVGAYASVVTPGLIRAGDEVILA